MTGNVKNTTKDWLRHASICLAAVLFASVTSAAAEVASPLAWDCWIGEHKPISINCIRHRKPMGQAIKADSDEAHEAMLLEVIHERIMSQRTAGLEEFVKAHLGDLGEGALHVIPIWDYPDEFSWMEGRPIELVRAMLCPEHTPCSVTLNKSARLNLTGKSNGEADGVPCHQIGGLGSV